MKQGTTQPGDPERPKPAPLDWDLMDLRPPRVDGPAVLSLGRNERGRDLVVSDIHGQRETFEHLLAKVGYSASAGDRLLLLGDLIDRGPDSASMLEWLQRDDVTCIRGNHEQMMLDSLEGDRMSEEVWIGTNGGEWSTSLTAAQKDAWRERIRSMPLAVEVEGGARPFRPGSRRDSDRDPLVGNEGVARRGGQVRRSAGAMGARQDQRAQRAGQRRA
ncbi:MAG: metallophosphoesterase [Bryobacterales bacterium]|nr:metallophosphoesterase [Bryobacterales bacterium]